MLRSFAVVAALLALVACGSNPSPTGMDLTSGAFKTIAPDGKPATVVMCGKIGWCMFRAKDICGAREPIVLNTKLGGDDAAVTFRCG